MFDSIAPVVVSAATSRTESPTERVAYARGFHTAAVVRLLGRCGRVADTAYPEHYAAVFRKVQSRFGRRVRFGFMVPMNLVIEGIVHHPLYLTKRLPQLAPLVLFKLDHDVWTARAVVSVTGFAEGDPQQQIFQQLTTLYADCGVEHLVLRVDLLQSGYLDTGDFKRRVGRAVYAPCVLPPQPLPTPRRVRSEVAA